MWMLKLNHWAKLKASLYHKMVVNDESVCGRLVIVLEEWTKPAQRKVPKASAVFPSIRSLASSPSQTCPGDVHVGQSYAILIFKFWVPLKSTIQLNESNPQSWGHRTNKWVESNNLKERMQVSQKGDHFHPGDRMQRPTTQLQGACQLHLWDGPSSAKANQNISKPQNFAIGKFNQKRTRRNRLDLLSVCREIPV